MKQMAILAVVLLAGCNGPGTAKPATSPTASATAIAVSTACPAAGKAATAHLAPVTLGSDPTIIYTDEPSANGGPVLSNLIRYDVTTASKALLLSAEISEAQVSPDGRWIAVATIISGRPALQLLGTDGQRLQTLFCSELSGNIRGILWAQDQESLLFSASGSSSTPPIYRLDLDKGTLQTQLRNNSLSADYAPLSWLDGNRLLIVGRPVGPGPGDDLRILDVGKGANQQASDLPLVLSSSAECWDADYGLHQRVQRRL